jgi:hypothetical protein
MSPGLWRPRSRESLENGHTRKKTHAPSRTSPAQTEASLAQSIANTARLVFAATRNTRTLSAERGRSE